jgi:hypothetical protein
MMRQQLIIDGVPKCNFDASMFTNPTRGKLLEMSDENAAEQSSKQLRHFLVRDSAVVDSVLARP